KRRAAALRAELLTLARRDSEAFEAVMRARRMTTSPPDPAGESGVAIAAAELEATRVPLRTAEACLEVVGLAETVARIGNPNAVSDAGVAGLLAAAEVEGALLNVEINLKSLAGNADRDTILEGLQRLRDAVGPATQRCKEAVRAVLDV